MNRPTLALAALVLLAPLPSAHVDSPRGSFDCLVPPSPVPFEVRQPDGTVAQVRLRGTALHHWLETAAGHPVVQRGEWFVYARLEDGALVATPAVVGVDDPRAHDIATGVRPRPSAVTGAPAQSRKAILASGAAPLPAGTRPAGPAPNKAVGQFDNLVILLRFSDHGAGGQNRDLPETADVGVIMNADGGDPVLAPTGSVRDHYLEDSYDQLTIDSTIVGWIDVPSSELYYCNGNSGLTDLTWQLIEDGLEGADPLVDFTDFDSDGDGWIDSITFLHSGYGAEWGGSDQYGTWYWDRMWSHKWTIPTWTSDEGVSVADYNISPGLWATSGDEPGRIGVVAHELGHFYGLPDIYDTTGGGQGLGNWDLMAAGSWDFNSEQLYPSHMSVWSKATLGWLNPTLIVPGAYVAEQIETSPSAFRIDSGYPPGEYLLIENRQNVGFDLVLPQSGLAIYHVDESKGAFGFNDVNGDEGFPGQSGWPTNGSHYRIAMLQADGGFDLEQSFDRGDAGDIFHGAAVDAIDGGTVPDLDAYQEGAIIANGNAILGIASSSPSMFFVYANAGAPSITTAELPAAALDVAYDETLVATGGSGTITWSEFRPNATYSQTDLGAVPFETGGTAQLWQADDDIWPLSLPFVFPYGETQYDTVYVSSNGFLDFAPTGSEPASRSAYLQSATRIAPLWDDLMTESGDIYVDTSTAGEVTVRWDAETYGTLEPAAFSVVLFEDGAIEFHYGPGNTALFPTVGISRSFGHHVELVPTHDGQSTLTNASSIRFELQGSQIPPGMTLSTAGVLSGTPTEGGTFTPTIRATDAEWVYGVKSFDLEVRSDPRLVGPKFEPPLPW